MRTNEVYANRSFEHEFGKKNEGYAKLRLSQWQGDGINSTHTQNYDILSRCLMELGEQHNVHYIM